MEPARGTTGRGPLLAAGAIVLVLLAVLALPLVPGRDAAPDRRAGDAPPPDTPAATQDPAARRAANEQARAAAAIRTWDRLAESRQLAAAVRSTGPRTTVPEAARQVRREARSLAAPADTLRSCLTTYPSEQVDPAQLTQGPFDATTTIVTAAAEPLGTTAGTYRIQIPPGAQCDLFPVAGEETVRVVLPVGWEGTFEPMERERPKPPEPRTWSAVAKKVEAPDAPVTLKDPFPRFDEVVFRLAPQTSLNTLLTRTGCIACDFRGARIADLDLTGLGSPLQISRSLMSGATLANVRMDESVQAVLLQWGRYGGAPALIVDSDLRGATLGWNRFTDTRILNTDLDGATLHQAQFRRVVIDSRSRIGKLVWKGGDERPISVAESVIPFPGFTRLDDRGRTTLGPIEMQDTDLVVTGANKDALKNGVVRSADLRGAHFVGLPPQFVGTRWENTRLADLDLSGARFDEGDLSGANLTYADFSGASMLGTDLAAVTAHGADFTRARLSNTRFAEARLGRGEQGTLAPATFDDADIRSSEFSGADLRGTSFRRTYLFRGEDEPGFARSYLQQAVFDEALVGNANFAHAHLDDASFVGTQCIACSFTNATLRRTNLRGSYLFGSDLAGAVLSGAVFADARYRSEGGTWTFAAGLGALPPKTTFLARDLTAPAYSDVASCPSGAAPNAQGCPGPLANPRNPPPLPPRCVSAGGHLCAMTITNLAGTGKPGFRDGEPGQAQFTDPRDVAVLAPESADPQILVADPGNHVIRAVPQRGGPVTVFAGTPGQAGSGGDGGPATEATLDQPVGVAVDSLGRVYIADRAGHRVRVVADGTIRTLAGTGSAGFAGDSGPATAAQLDRPEDVSVACSSAEQCTVAIADSGNNRVRVIDEAGTIRTVAGTGEPQPFVPAGPGLRVPLDRPSAVAFDSRGSLYAADSGHDVVRRIDPEGTVEVFKPDKYDKDFATPDPTGVTVDATDTVMITTGGNSQASRWNFWGAEEPGVLVNRTGAAGDSGDGGDALAAQLRRPGALLHLGNGSFVIADTGNHRVRLLTPSR